MCFNIIKECLFSNLNIIGLIFNFIGTILFVFYISKDPNEYVEDEKWMKPGEKYYALLIKHPYYLKVGIVLIALGFIFSLIHAFLY